MGSEMCIRDSCIADHYNVSDFPPIDISKCPHIALLATPALKSKEKNYICRTVFDLRESKVQDFVSELRKIEWSFLLGNSLSLDQKAELFHKTLEEIFKECIPHTEIRCTAKDKPWITNVIKDMINKRWDAYRNRNFCLYNHLKIKIRLEIIKS